MRSLAILLAFLMLTLSLSGCFGNEEVVEVEEPEVEIDTNYFITDNNGDATNPITTMRT